MAATLQRRIPSWTATPDTKLTPRSPAGITFRPVTSQADLTAAATVQHHAHQVPHPPGPHDIARVTRLIQRGGLVVGELCCSVLVSSVVCLASSPAASATSNCQPSAGDPTSSSAQESTTG
jgi:hypothetical protein